MATRSVMPRRHATNLLEVQDRRLMAVMLAAQRQAGRVTKRLG